MTVLETILFLGVAPVVLYLAIAFAVALPRLARRPKYRPGQPWTYQPLWWTANPAGAELPAVDANARTGERGGARGNW